MAEIHAPLTGYDRDGNETDGYTELYLIEELADSATDHWTVMPRYDENGAGSPLVFTDAAVARAVVETSEEASGCYGGSRIAVMRLAGRLIIPPYCAVCGQRGHPENDPLNCPDYIPPVPEDEDPGGRWGG